MFSKGDKIEIVDNHLKGQGSALASLQLEQDSAYWLVKLVSFKAIAFRCMYMHEMYTDIYCYVCLSAYNSLEYEFFIFVYKTIMLM